MLAYVVNKMVDVVIRREEPALSLSVLAMKCFKEVIFKLLIDAIECFSVRVRAPQSSRGLVFRFFFFFKPPMPYKKVEERKLDNYVLNNTSLF